LKKAMMRVARAMAMATATKRAMATNGDNTGNGKGKEVGKQATAATMAMGKWGGGWHKGHGHSHYAWREGDDHATTGEREMMVAMGHGLCVSFFCVERPQKIRSDLKKSQCFLEHRPREVSNS
jgi:hypothetical protein